MASTNFSALQPDATNTVAGSFVATGNTWDFSGTTAFKFKVGASSTITNAGTSGQIPISNGDGTFTVADPFVSGPVAHDGAGAAVNPLPDGCFANAAAPADVSNDVDITRAWCLRNGSRVMNLAFGGTLVTAGQKTMANSFPVVFASDQSPLSVTLTSTTITGTVGVTQSTSPWVVDMAKWAGTTLGVPTNFGTTPGAVIVGSVNASLFSGTTALGTPNTFGTTAPTGNALGVNSSLFIGTTVADGNSGNKSAGTLRVVIATDQVSLTTPFNTNVAQINGVTPLMGAGNTGTGSPRVTLSTDQAAVATWGQGATGSAAPTGAVQIGGDASGAAGAPVLTAPLNCDGYAKYDASTNGATELVALVASKVVYVCGYTLTSSSATANTLKLVYGTGTACATGQTAMTPGFVLQAPASTGPIGKVVPVSGWGRGLKTASANALCILTNAAQTAQAEVWYAQF